MRYNEFGLQEMLINQQCSFLTKRLDQLVFSRWHMFVVICLGMTWIFDGYEVSMLTLTSIEMQKYYNVNEGQIGKIASVYLLGCCAGALFFGYLSSRFGRKRLFSITLIIYFISVICVLFADEYNFFLICRFFTGISVGGEYSAIFAAVDEFIPPLVRGRVDIILDGSWHFGSFLASCISLIVYNNFVDDKKAHNTFQWLFIFGGLGCIPLIFLRSRVPESPRWLINAGKKDQARKIIQFIEYCVQNNKILTRNKYEKLTENYVEQTDEIVQENKLQSETASNRKFNENRNINSSFSDGEIKEDYYVAHRVSIVEIFRHLFKIYPKRFILGFTVMATQAFFFQGIFYTFAMILKDFYQVQQKDVGYFMIPIALSSFTGPIVIGRYFDTVGRRIMIFSTFTSCAVLLSIAAFLFQTHALTLTTQCIAWVIVFFVASPGASSAHLTVSEIFPLQMRSQAMAIFYSAGLGIGGAAAPYIFGILISEHSRSKIAAGYYLASFLMLIGGVVGLILGVNAENKPLEEISQMQYETNPQDGQREL